MVGTIGPFGPDGESSAIGKHRVEGSLRLDPLGFSGDTHADPNHGGADKAALHYAREHYDMWRKRFPEFSPGTGTPGECCFGENISTHGMTEETVCLGDRYRMGDEVVVEVSQARQPCWKLGLNANVLRIPPLMQELATTGWYYRVITPGPVQAGDRIDLIERPLPDWPLSRLIVGFYTTPLDGTVLEAMVGLRELSAEWRNAVERRLSTGRVEDWAPRLYGSLPHPDG